MGYMYSKCLTPGESVDKQSPDNKTGISQDNKDDNKNKEENKNNAKPYFKNGSVIIILLFQIY